MNKAFTLIELLAVILILGIIALIAIPTVTNIISESKQESFKVTVSNISASVEQNCQLEILKGLPQTNTYVITNKKIDPSIEMKGNMPQTGTFTVDKDCKIILINASNEGIALTQDALSKNIEVVDNIKVFKTFITGNTKEVSTIYFNPTTGEKCDKEKAVSTPLTTNGCMKWYSIENSGLNKKTVNAILDHNSASTVAWNTTGNNTVMGEIAVKFNESIANWKPILTPRLVTAKEIADALKHPSFDESTADSAKRFAFDTLEWKLTTKPTGSSNYSWLFDYTKDCTQYGCFINDQTSNGYWTQTPTYNTSNNHVWTVGNGYLSPSGRAVDGYYGVRPVIKIPKEKL
ncbi:MAG: prepilin-type N-terminal cleavage/methylation domain-containing protein [Bacilli bacterium]